MRIVYFGSTAFSLAGLDTLEAAGHEVIAVVTQPDRPAGRGRALRRTPVKEWAEARDIPVLQPERVADAQAELGELHPDLAVVSAYGGLIPQALLEMPRRGFINLHASLLPRWRGAAPIQRALIAGDAGTGVTLMAMDEGLDTGDILAGAAVPIEDEDNFTTLEEKLARSSAELLKKYLPAYAAGDLAPRKQNDADATYAPPIGVEERRIVWTRSGTEIHNQVRALAESPGAFTQFRGKRLIVLKTRLAGASRTAAENPGDTRIVAGELLVATGDGFLVLERVKPEGKRSMGGEEFLRGYRVNEEDRLRMGE